jgi:hypothetical protein
MKRTYFTIILLSVLGVMACQKESIVSSESVTKPLSDDYLVFGQVGLGWGCRVSALFLISDGKLYADTTNNFCKDQDNYRFSGYQLPDNEYNKVKDLIAQFPTELSKEGTKTFGCPGCADGGMLFLQRKEKGQEVKSWRIDETIFYRDTDVTNNPFPAYLLPYGKAFGKIIPDIKYK